MKEDPVKTTIRTAMCYHCGHIIDLENESYILIDTLESLIRKQEKAKAHELCAVEFDAEMSRDRAIGEWLEEQTTIREGELSYEL
jgi:hypothetical protein